MEKFFIESFNLLRNFKIKILKFVCFCIIQLSFIDGINNFDRISILNSLSDTISSTCPSKISEKLPCVYKPDLSFTFCQSLMEKFCIYRWLKNRTITCVACCKSTFRIDLLVVHSRCVSIKVKEQSLFITKLGDGWKNSFHVTC